MLDHVWIRHTCCFQLLQQQKDAPFLAKLAELLQQEISGWLSQDGPAIGIDTMALPSNILVAYVLHSLEEASVAALPASRKRSS